jgi:hypothetical protein
MLAGISKTANPAVYSAAPGGFFFALTANKARADIEFFADKGWVVHVRRTDVTRCVASSCNALIVFEVLNASEGVFFVFIEF